MIWSIPDDLTRRMRDRESAGGPAGHEWLAGLRSIVDERIARWDLEVDGSPLNGHNALTLPVTRGDEPLVLKVSWPHPEAAFEHVGLRHWSGRGAVRLVAADPGSTSLLLERLGPTDLTTVDEPTGTEVIGRLLQQLHVAAPPSVPTFAQATGTWFAPLRAHPDHLPRRWVDRALEVYDHRRDDHVLLHGDLHYLNVLSATRAPWLAIDPKPMAGPRGFDLYPLIANRVDDHGTGADFGHGVRDRLCRGADAAEIDLDAARDWCIAHAVLNAHEFARDGWPALTTLNLAIAKAIDDL